MHANHLTSHRRSELLLIVALAWAMGLAGCGGPIAFEGKSAFAITGQPPPPPPPPPPPEPEPEPEPPKPPPRVEVRDNQIIIREKIQFEYNKARILEASFGLLDEVAAVIQQNSHIKKIRIEGHASSEGNDDYNLRLSERRASAVMKYLVEHGIPQEALEAKGFGETKPAASSSTSSSKRLPSAPSRSTLPPGPRRW